MSASFKPISIPPPRGRTKTDDKTVDEILTRGVVNVINKNHLKKKLKSGKPLRVKYGIDPTGPDIHIGHAVPIRKLKHLQEAGHQIIIIMGDWTARIGDPTDRNEMRPQLTAAEVNANAKKFFNQLFKILDKEKTIVVRQSKWFDKFNLQDVFTLLAKFTVAQLLDRDDFKKRIADGIEVGYHEPIYSLLQAYDSVAIEADVEIGATEQLFNLLRGRDLQCMAGQEPQDIMTNEILVGLDGHRKMGKSLGNYIGLNDKPEDMFGKVMSIPDDVIVNYFLLATEVAPDKIAEVKKKLERRSTNPRDVKMRLAREVVGLYHDTSAVKKAEEAFIRVFQKRELPEHIETVKLKPWPKNVAKALVDASLVKSMAEARRLIEQGGIKLDGRVVKDINERLPKKSKTILSRGKRDFRRLIPAK